MFGMGFMEIMLVVIVAIIALGPEKLPTALVDIAKFFKQFKSGIDDAKTTINQELHIGQMKKEAEELKASFDEIKNVASIDLDEIEEPAQKKKKKNKENDSKVTQIETSQNPKKESVSFDKKENA